MSDEDGPERRQDRELDLEEHPQYQERMWRIERAGWAVMAVVVLAAVGGLFGHGPLGRTEIVTAVPGDRFWPVPHATLVARVAFHRYIRLNSPSAIRLSETVFPARGDGTERALSLWLSADYLDAVELGHMTPRPEAEQLDSDGITYHFRVRTGSAVIVVPFKAVKVGYVSGSVRINHAPVMSLGHFVYP